MTEEKETLYEHLNAKYIEGWFTWFERWYKRADIEHEMIVAACQGFRETRILVGNFAVSAKPGTEPGTLDMWHVPYTERRMRDFRFGDAVSEKLGPGITAELKTEVDSFFGLTRYKTYLKISWQEE